MEKRKHGEMETWKNGDMEAWTCRHGHGDMDIKRETESFTVCSSCKQKFVIRPFADEETEVIHLQTEVISFQTD